MPIDPRNVCLGRAAHDPGRVAAVRPHIMGADAAPPTKLDRSNIPFVPGMYSNNILPNCTAVSTANIARAFSWIRAGCDIVVDPAKVPSFYASCVGCADTEAAMLATDGAVILDVLERAAAHGYDVGQQVSLFPGHASIDPGNRAMIAHAALTMGAADLGVQLSVSDQKMAVWDTVAPADAGDPTAGSWGGHDLFLWDWDGLDDTSLVRLGTWGGFYQATWRWVQARAEEAYALDWPQLLSA